MTTEIRQRIEGPLLRVLPATITIRTADPTTDGAPLPDADGLLRLHVSASSDVPYLRQSWFEDPWVEVLGHKPGEADLSRFESGAGVVMANHDRYTAIGNTPLASIGIVENATLNKGRMEADLLISRREALADLRTDIADGLVRNVSIGYTIDERILVKQGKDGAAPEYRVTKWAPFEISLVDVPADATIGVGRSMPDAEANPSQSRYRVIDLPAPSAGAPTTSKKGASTMNETVDTADEQQAATTKVNERTAPVVDDIIKAERARMKEIHATAKMLKIDEAIAQRAIHDGLTIEQFQKTAIELSTERGTLRQADSAEIGMSKKDVQEYSFCRALLAVHDPINAHKIAPFEAECSRAAQDKLGDGRMKGRETAITIPSDVLNSGMRMSQDASDAAFRRFMAAAMQRDLVVGTASAGGNLVATDLMASSFIDLLRNAMILDKLGIIYLRDLVGNVAIPSQTGAATGYWVAEGNAPTESQQTIGQVPLTPKTCGAFTDFSRKLLLQASRDVEAFVRADLASVLGQTIQTAAFFGSGTAPEPYGVGNTTGIGSVAGGTNGGAPTYDLATDMETAISVANADANGMKFVTNAKVRGKLRKTQEFASTNGKAVWTSSPVRGVGDVLGYEAYVTNTIPSNLTKGTASGICSAILFGDWTQFVLGMWGGLDLMLDPYALATSGGKRVIALQDVDFALRHVEAFCAMKDALTT